MKKPLVYIASPYAEGDQIINIRSSIDVFNELRHDGKVTPIAPLLAFSAHLCCPSEPEKWMAYDIELISHCDALLAQNVDWGFYKQNRSKGRAKEIEFADRNDIPVFWSVDDLYFHFLMIDNLTF
jgi:hypothetical protein